VLAIAPSQSRTFEMRKTSRAAVSIWMTSFYLQRVYLLIEGSETWLELFRATCLDKLVISILLESLDTFGFSHLWPIGKFWMTHRDKMPRRYIADPASLPTLHTSNGHCQEHTCPCLVHLGTPNEEPRQQES
jgi:hypothetical protein